MTTTDGRLHLPSPQPLHTSPSAPRPLVKIIRMAMVLLGLVAVAAAAGASYEELASAGDAAAYPPRGRLVEIGGLKLHLDCRGEGSPTVVMDAGLGGSSLDWALVQPELARTTRVCTYDRAGMGWSEPRAGSRSPGQLAGELHALLHNGGIRGPLVLVGHSLAGKTIRIFANAHPGDVAGMVLVDARSEIVDADADPKAFAAALDAQAILYSVARRLGIVRLFGPMLVDLPELPPSLTTEMALVQTGAGAIAATTREGLSRTGNDAALASAKLGGLPLVVIAAGKSMTTLPHWPAAQQAMAALSTNGRLVIAEDSSHAIHLDEPGVVVDAVLSIIAALRSTD